MNVLHLVYILENLDFENPQINFSSEFSTNIDFNNEKLKQFFPHKIINHCVIIKSKNSQNDFENKLKTNLTQNQKIRKVVISNSLTHWWNSMSRNMLKDNGFVILLNYNSFVNVIDNNIEQFIKIITNTQDNVLSIWKCKNIEEQTYFPYKSFGKTIGKNDFGWGCFCFKTKQLRNITLGDGRDSYGLYLKLVKECKIQWFDEVFILTSNNQNIIEHFENIRKVSQTSESSIDETEKQHKTKLSDVDEILNNQDIENITNHVSGLLREMQETFGDQSIIPIDKPDNIHYTAEQTEYVETDSDSNDDIVEDDYDKYLSEKESAVGSDEKLSDTDSDELKYDESEYDENDIIDSDQDDDVDVLDNVEIKNNQSNPEETPQVKQNEQSPLNERSELAKVSDSELNERQRMKALENDDDDQLSIDSDVEVNDLSSSSDSELEYQDTEIQDTQLELPIEPDTEIESPLEQKPNIIFDKNIVPHSICDNPSNIYSSNILQLDGNTTYILSENTMTAIAKLIVDCLDIKEKYDKILRQIELTPQHLSISTLPTTTDPSVSDKLYISHFNVPSVSEGASTMEGSEHAKQHKIKQTKTISRKREIQNLKKLGGKRSRRLIDELKYGNSTNSISKPNEPRHPTVIGEITSSKISRENKFCDKAILNEAFNSVYIIRISGKDKDISNFLLANQVDDYVLVHPKIPSQIAKIVPKTPEHLLIFGYMEAIKHAKEKNHRKILILSDNVIFHKDFMYEFYQSMTKIPVKWKLLYLGARHKLGRTNPFNKFDWRFYLDTYTDLDSTVSYTQKDAEEHWRRFGIKEGRIGCREVYHPSGKVSGLFAVGINESLYDVILNRIGECIQTNHYDDILVDIQRRYQSECFVIRPNVVIEMIEHKTHEQLLNLMKEYQWDYNFYNIGLH
jgi:hypothetical protein